MTFWKRVLSPVVMPFYADLTIVNLFKVFSTHASVPRRVRASLIVSCATGIFPALQNLLDGIKPRKIVELDAPDFARDSSDRARAEELASLFKSHGSDKASVHDYHHIYGRILAQRDQPRCVLEIGLGSNDPSIVSNMGADGTPGASVRAFRDFLPAGEIYGADVDPRTLFTEERIRTFQVDQTDFNSLCRLGEKVDRRFDLIIDDGLHNPLANVNVLSFALSRLKPGGFVVIEDIGKDNLPIWQVVARLLPHDLEIWLVRARKGHLFVVRAPE